MRMEHVPHRGFYAGEPAMGGQHRSDTNNHTACVQLSIFNYPFSILTAELVIAE
jgi:hypothetical protein